MIKKMLYAVVIGCLLFGIFMTAPLWAGQVVTDSHRNWAKVALAQEKALEAVSSPNTLAVLYFINKCGRPELDPVQKGLAYMLITDLSKVDGLKLVERVKLQALVEELDLGASGLVDPAMAPRVGFLLGAAHVVSGRFYNCGLEKFGIDPGLLSMPEAEVSDLPDSRGLLEEIFRMEKEVLFNILDALKKTPTEALALEALQKPMTTSFEALMFLFKGFNESDLGNYHLAAKYYKRSLKADPMLMPAAESLKELQILGLIGKKKDSRAFLKSLRDRTSLTDRLSPDQVVRRARTPRDVEKRQSLRPAKPDDVDDDGDGFTENQGDCNDTDASIYPGATEICGDGIDQDCDGSDTVCPDDVDNDGDGFTENQGDCNDSDAGTYPGASEICGDGIDQDCSGKDDTCQMDKDDDGDGYTETSGDCDDANSAINPGATDACGDGIDQDCDGSDVDCPEDVDNDGDGYSEAQGDCDDQNAAVYPSATDICGDGIDQDCNGTEDSCAEDIDDDKDGYTENEGDCNDNDAAINPEAPEVCEDGIDQDCNGKDAICPNSLDNDGDGYSESMGDCNDGDASIYPSAQDICEDGIDQNCDGTDALCTADVDNDQDGYTENQGDCNDEDSSIHPGAEDICLDFIDQDCDGSDAQCTGEVDMDGDGYTPSQGDCNDDNPNINPGVTSDTCGDGIDQDCNGEDTICPENMDNDRDGYIRQNDCDDNNPNINPGAAEICGNDTDENCDGVPAACQSDTDPKDIDNDKDGFTENQGDCNDSNPGIHPQAQEICGDRIDQNCDGIAPPCIIDPNDIDNDKDGYTENQGDCNDDDPNINPLAKEICGDKIDQNCDGFDPFCIIIIDPPIIPINPNFIDNDGDGYSEVQGDCNDDDAKISPGTKEVCFDKIDNDCDGSIDENCVG